MRGALNKFASAQSDQDAGPIGELPTQGEGIIDRISKHSVDETYSTITGVINDNPKLRIILELDHQANAKRVGLELRPTKLIVFGNPNLGTPLMQSAQTVALDLPQKILVWEDDNQRVHVSYNDPFYLQSRHGISGKDSVLETVAGALGKITGAGVGTD